MKLQGTNLKIYGYIYKITNLTNGKVYIGQSKCRFNKRYAGGRWWDTTHNKHLKNATKKYGVSKFYVNKCLDIAFSKIELDIKEDMYIKLYSAMDERYGYNKKEGGANGVVSKESRKKASMSRIGFDIDEYKGDIINLYNNEFKPLSEIANIYKVSLTCIKGNLQRWGIKIKNASEVKLGFCIEYEKDNIITMYKEGVSPNCIAELYKIDSGCVLHYLKKWNIGIRDQSETKLGFKIENEKFNIMNMYEKEKKTLSEIGLFYGIGITTVKDHLIKWNVELRSDSDNKILLKGLNLEQYQDDIIKSYIENKMSMKEIANQYNVSSDTIKTRLKKWGVKTRSKIEYAERGEDRYNSTTIEIYDLNNNLINIFKSREECVVWMVKNKLVGSISSGRSTISRVANNEPYKGYIFKKYTKEEYNELIKQKQTKSKQSA